MDLTPTIKARVTAETSVYEKRHKVGDEVMVDEKTFANLEKKGRLERVDEKAESGKRKAETKKSPAAPPE